MATVSWKPNADGDWGVASNWSAGSLPGATDAVVLGGTAPYVVTFSAGAASVASVAATMARVAVTGGSLAVTNAASFAAGLSESGGTLVFGGTTSVAGAFAESGGALSLGSGATLTLAGAATLSAGVISGAGTLVTRGAVAVTADAQGGLLSLDGTLTWNNSGVVSDAASVFLDFPSGLGTVAIVNAAGGTFDLTADSAGVYNAGAAATFVNAGTLSKTAGTAGSFIYAAVVNTGTLTATSGTLELAGGGTLGGTIGATKTGALALTFGTFTLGGTTQTITGPLALNGGTLALATGQTLTLSGTVAMSSGAIDGPGTLVTTGTTSITGIVDLDGSLAWTNSGTISSLGELALNTPSGTGNIAITNTVAGVFDLAQDGWSVYSYLLAGTFANAGILAKTVGTGTSNIFTAVANTGTLTASTGTLELDGGGTLGGVIGATKTGVLALGFGTFTLGGATQTVTGTLALDGGTVSIAAGDVLTLSGAVALSSGGILGPGTLMTTGVTTITGLAGLDGSLIWHNSGTVADAGQLNLDFPSSLGVIAITNMAGGVFDLTADRNSVVNYGLAATFTNAGILSKTAGTGTSALSSALANTGTVTATTGTLELDGGGTLGGTVGATGSGRLALGGGVFTFPAPTPTIAGALLIDGGTIALAAGQSLTLSGAVAMTSGAVLGPGTLLTTKTISFANASSLDGGLRWTNSGTVSNAGQISLDAPSGAGGVAITNGATGIFNLTADGAALLNAGGAPSFANAGTLSKTIGTGISIIGVAVTTTGIVTAITGTLALSGGGSIAGSIGATTTRGVVLLAGGAFATTGTATIADDGAANGLVLGSNETWAVSGRLLDAGHLVLGSTATLGAAATLTIAAGSALTLTTKDAVISAKGTAAIINAGTITTTLVSGIGTISAPVTNAGLIDATGGTLAVTGIVSGTGAMRIEAGSTLELGQAPIATQTVSFNGLGATLKLDTPGSVAKALQGFGTGDSIDLAGVTLTSASIALKTLTMRAGTTAYTVTAAASLAANHAQLVADGSGGSIVTLYAVALATVHTPQPVAFGNLHVGQIAVQALSISNKAVVGPYTETLDASLGGVTKGFTTAGNITRLAAGQTNSTALVITATTTTAGAVSGSTKLALESDGTGIDNLGQTALPSQTITMTASVYAYAAPNFSATTLTLAARVGGTLAGAVTLGDGTAANAYQESLVYQASAPTGVTLTGGGGTILAGNAATLGVTMASTLAGTISGKAIAVALTSTGLGTSGLANTALASQTITVNAKVYALAAAKLAVARLSFGIVHVGDTAKQSLIVTNAGTCGLVDALAAGSATTSGSVVGVTYALGTGGLAAGAAGTVSVAINTLAAGTISGNATLGFVSHDGDLADQAIAGGVVTVTGTVDNYAVAQIEKTAGAGTLTQSGNAYVLNLGSVAQNGTALTANLGLLNAATGPADLLSGSFAAIAAAGFTNTGFSAVSGLAAGKDEKAQVVTLSTGTAGTFTETIVLTPTGSNAGGYSGVLANDTITVTGTIVSAGITGTLLAGTKTVATTNGNDVINAASNTLVAGQVIDGGAGTNSLNLLGAGTFNLAAPTTLADIQIVTAQESRTGTFITMRAGLNVTLNVAPAGIGSVIIHGAVDSDIFNLGVGSDTVILGAATETVKAGGGLALVQATAAQGGALVVGGTLGTTTLELTAAGAATLNAGDAHLVVKLDAATNLGLGAATFITAVGSTTFGDSFINTAAGFAGDTIKAFGGSDTIDITDLAWKTFKTLAYAGTPTAGTMTATDGTHSATIAMTGSYVLANFTAVSDGHTGTLVTFEQH